jgi:stage II sporulation protein D
MSPRATDRQLNLAIVVLLSVLVAGCASRGGTPRPQPHPTRSTPSSERPATPEHPERPARPGAPSRDTGLPVVDSIVLRLDSGRVTRLALDEYVAGAVAAEAWVRSGSDPGYAEKVFEVQALVARTYAVANLGRHRDEGADLCSTTHCQIYRPVAGTHPWRDVIQDAVRRTSGQVILYGGAPILALFHANCGGATSAAQDIWGGAARPYLASVPDEPCAREPASSWRISLPRDEVVRALDRDPRTNVGGRLDSIDLLQLDPVGRVMLVGLTGGKSPVVRGEELRAVLMRAFGARSIQGPRFRVRREGEAFVFEGTGVGHGAGLCQYGAAARLRGGATPTDVIRYYYPGTVIGTMRGET